MDVAFQRQLIRISLKTAEESKHESMRDIFLAQAARIEADLNAYLKENPECLSAKAVKANPKQEKVKRKSSPTGDAKRTKTSSNGVRKPSQSRAKAARSSGKSRSARPALRK